MSTRTNASVISDITTFASDIDCTNYFETETIADNSFSDRVECKYIIHAPAQYAHNVEENVFNILKSATRSSKYSVLKEYDDEYEVDGEPMEFTFTLTCEYADLDIDSEYWHMVSLLDALGTKFVCMYDWDKSSDRIDELLRRM